MTSDRVSGGRLAGKFALVTGGSVGIGLASAKLFREQGARVAITGRDPQALTEARETLGPETLCLRSDASDLEQVRWLFATLAREFPRLDVLFLNAGIGLPTPIRTADEATFDKVFETNVKSLFFSVQAALPMLASGASIILNASIAPRAGVPGMGAYAASKAAVISLARSLSAELVGEGIRVNTISPGPIDTGGWARSGLTGPALDAALARQAQATPIGRLGLPHEIAKVALFLASEDSSYLLGAEIVVDGGMVGLPGGAARDRRRG